MMDDPAYPVFGGFGFKEAPSAGFRALLPVYPGEWLLGSPMSVGERLTSMVSVGLATSPFGRALFPSLIGSERREPDASPRDLLLRDALARIPDDEFAADLPLLEGALDPLDLERRRDLARRLREAAQQGARLGLVGQLFAGFFQPENLIVPGVGLGRTLTASVLRQAAFAGGFSATTATLDVLSLPSDLRPSVLEATAIGLVAGAAIGAVSHGVREVWRGLAVDPTTVGVAVDLAGAAEARARSAAMMVATPEGMRPIWEAAEDERTISEVLRKAYTPSDVPDPHAVFPSAFLAARSALRAEELVTEYHETLRSIAGLSHEEMFERATRQHGELVEGLRDVTPADLPRARIRAFAEERLFADVPDFAALAEFAARFARRLADELGLFDRPLLIRIADELPHVPTIVPRNVQGTDRAVLDTIERLAQERTIAIATRGAHTMRLVDPETGIWSGGHVIDVSPSWLERQGQATTELAFAIAHEIGHILLVEGLAHAPDSIRNAIALQFAEHVHAIAFDRRLAEILGRAATDRVPAGAWGIRESMIEAEADARAFSWRSPALVGFREWIAVQVAQITLARQKMEPEDPRVRGFLRRASIRGLFDAAGDKLEKAFNEAARILKTEYGIDVDPGMYASAHLRRYVEGLKGNALRAGLVTEAQALHSFAEMVRGRYERRAPTRVPVRAEPERLVPRRRADIVSEIIASWRYRPAVELIPELLAGGEIVEGPPVPYVLRHEDPRKAIWAVPQISIVLPMRPREKPDEPLSWEPRTDWRDDLLERAELEPPEPELGKEAIRDALLPEEQAWRRIVWPIYEGWRRTIAYDEKTGRPEVVWSMARPFFAHVIIVPTRTTEVRVRGFLAPSLTRLFVPSAASEYPRFGASPAWPGGPPRLPHYPIDAIVIEAPLDPDIIGKGELSKEKVAERQAKAGLWRRHDLIEREVLFGKTFLPDWTWSKLARDVHAALAIAGYQAIWRVLSVHAPKELRGWLTSPEFVLASSAEFDQVRREVALRLPLAALARSPTFLRHVREMRERARQLLDAGQIGLDDHVTPEGSWWGRWSYTAREWASTEAAPFDPDLVLPRAAIRFIMDRAIDYLNAEWAIRKLLEVGFRNEFVGEVNEQTARIALFLARLHFVSLFQRNMFSELGGARALIEMFAAPSEVRAKGPRSRDPATWFFVEQHADIATGVGAFIALPGARQNPIAVAALQAAMFLGRGDHFPPTERMAWEFASEVGAKQMRVDRARAELETLDPMVKAFGLSAVTSAPDIDTELAQAIAAAKNLLAERKERATGPRVLDEADEAPPRPVAVVLNEIAGRLEAVLRAHDRITEQTFDDIDDPEYWKATVYASIAHLFRRWTPTVEAIYDQASQAPGETLFERIAYVIAESPWFRELATHDPAAGAVLRAWEQFVESVAREAPTPHERFTVAKRYLVAALSERLEIGHAMDERGLEKQMEVEFGSIGIARLEVEQDRERIARGIADEFEGIVHVTREELPPRDESRAVRFRGDRLIDRLLRRVTWRQMPWWVLTNNAIPGRAGERVAELASRMATVPGLEMHGNAVGIASIQDSVEARATVYQSLYLEAEAEHRAAMVEGMGRPIVARGPARARLLEAIERISPTIARAIAKGERTPIAWDFVVRRALSDEQEADDPTVRRAVAAWRRFFDRFLEEAGRRGILIVDRYAAQAKEALENRLSRWQKLEERMREIDDRYWKGAIRNAASAPADGDDGQTWAFGRLLLDTVAKGIEDTRARLDDVADPPPVRGRYVPRLWLRSQIRANRDGLRALFRKYGLASQPVWMEQTISILADDSLAERLDGLIEAAVELYGRDEPWMPGRDREFRETMRRALLKIVDEVEPSRLEVERASLLGQRIARKWTTERRRAVQRAFEEIPAAFGIRADAIKTFLEAVDWDAVFEGLPTGEQPLHVMIGPKFARERRLDAIPDAELVAAGFVDPTITGTAGVYLRDMSRAIAFADVLGDPDGALGMVEALVDAYEAVLAAPPAERGTLVVELARVYEALQQLRAAVLLRAGLPDDPDAISARTVQFMTASAIAAQLGRAVFSAIGDVGRIAMAVGLKRAGLTVLLTAFDRRVREIAKQEAHAAGIAADVVLAGRSRGWFEQMSMTRERLPIERYAQLASEVAVIANLLAPWTDLASQWAGLALSSEFVELSIALASGKADANQIRRAAMFGIDLDLARAIVREWERAGSQSVRVGKTVLYLASTGEWMDRELVTRYRAMLASAVAAHAVIKPQAADLPMFLRTPLGRALFLYRGFSVAATWRIAASALQQRDAYALSGVLAMIALAYVVEAMTESKYEIDNPTHRLLRAIERSGVVGIFGDLNRTLSAATAGAVDIRQALRLVPPVPSLVDLRPPIRARSAREIDDRLSALAGAAVGPWVRLAGALAEPDAADTVRAVRDMIWGQNMIWWSWAVDELERSALGLLR